MADGTPVPGSVWFYAPTNVAPIPFAVLFGISAVFHLWQCFHYRCFWVTAYLPFCNALFTAGFALREVGAFNYGNVNVYLASTLMVYMAPPILELANYHILGRTLYYVPYFSPIHPGRVLTTLGSLSAMVEVLNALGVAYLTTSRTPDAKHYALGSNLLRASLALQLAVILLFYSLAGLFHVRCAGAGVGHRHRRVRAVLVSLYVSMALILARTVYRAVEHFAAPIAAGGGAAEAWRNLSPVIRYEWFFWVFEATPMLINVLMWNARHPRIYLPQSYRQYLAQDGETELDGPGWGDKRNKVMTLVDPFGFLSMCEKGRTGEPFWERNGYHHVLVNMKGTERQAPV
ncbi:hypothetical protein N657DRAFT_483262 [Parathielavia appendiculata]|uniref:RTA1 domain-containing protein n=1 Tax=Parathielavia appendiculata TaxID=2587402 RepID=A0AAN6TYH6_9PEZI|nr:hypothetical protein N657DRAFT_483262 [Parathielavia appendiculata]